MALLGRAVRHEWPLDWDFLSVNHGSFGAAPRVVLVAQRDWQLRLESQPGRFMRTVLPDALRHAADRLGGFIGAEGRDIVFVDNATTGCNAVLRSLHLAPDDEIVVLSHGYGAVRNTVRLDMRALGADWYAGNCHKWLCAPKGSAFLYARRDRQDDLHPVTISHGLGRGYLEEFDWTGTRDPSAWLATETALGFHARLGGEAMMARNVALAAEATSLLSRRLNTEPGATGAMAGCMGVVRLPLSGAATPERSADLRARLLAAGTDAPTHVQAGAIWLRISAAAYNDIDDYERLAELVARVLREVD